jgi:minichromosome maintenance protein 10
VRDRASRLLQDGNEDDPEDDEDEETLELKLAAIEARLKLKRLQQSKTKTAFSGSDVEDEGSRRPGSALARPVSRLNAMRERLAGDRRPVENDVQVPLSPSKRLQAAVESESPRRALFNINKKAADVSLRRPPSSRAGPRPTSSFSSRDARTADGHSSPDIWSPASTEATRPKSFSERMAESRNAEKARQERAQKVQKSRSTAFQIDKAEIERLKEAAASQPQSTSPVKSRLAESFSREDVLRSVRGTGAGLRKSETTPNLRGPNSGTSSQDPESSTRRFAGNSSDTAKLEPYSGLQLSNRILPQSFLSRTLEDKKILRIPQLLQTVKAPEFELPEIEGDLVVFGIVASKSDPKQHKDSKKSTKEVDVYDDGLNNTDKYMVITLTDLKWTVDLFLFDTAFPRYYKLSKGTLIAILNPVIMPPPPNKIDTGRFSLCLSSSDDTVLEIGSARDIGYCKAERKDGKACQSWLDARKTEFCDFHVDVQIRRTQSQRSGINSGTGMFAPGGRSASRIANFGSGDGGDGPGNKNGHGRRGLKTEGARYDFESQSTYYIAPAPQRSFNQSFSHRGGMNRSTSSLLDAEDDNPFLAAGMNGVRSGESKEERHRRRLIEQQRERDIAKKLGSRPGFSSNTGAEYLRARVAENNTPFSSSSSPAAARGGTSTPNSNLTITPRNAESVRLSPMKRRAHDDDSRGGGGGASSSKAIKKTRFITSKGIREAGRDSLGANDLRRTAIMSSQNNDDDDDDDDELDII